MAFGREVAATITFVVLCMQRLLVLGKFYGALECEMLPVELCAFSVSSSGYRCVLGKNYSLPERSPLFHCESSAVIAKEMTEWIESEECMESCGLQRMSVGMSIDCLDEYSDFSCKLCSDKCQTSCPNVVDFYRTLADEEGIYLPHLCEAHKKYSKRMAFQFQKGKGKGKGNGNGNGNDNDLDIEGEDVPPPLYAPSPHPQKA